MEAPGNGLRVLPTLLFWLQSNSGPSCSKDGRIELSSGYKYYQNLLSYPMDSDIHPLNNWGHMVYFCFDRSLFSVKLSLACCFPSVVKLTDLFMIVVITFLCPVPK